MKRNRGRGGGAEVKEEDPLKLTLYRDPWVVKKRLMASDLGHLSRVVLPSLQVEKHVLPSLTPNEQSDLVHGPGVEVWVFDLDTWTTHLLSFEKWQSNWSYKLGLNWVSEFVERRELRTGDEIGMFWVDSARGFYFSVIGRAPPPPGAAVVAVPAIPETAPPDPSICEYARKHLRLSPPVLEDFV